MEWWLLPGLEKISDMSGSGWEEKNRIRHRFQMGVEGPWARIASFNLFVLMSIFSRLPYDTSICSLRWIITPLMELK